MMEKGERPAGHLGIYLSVLCTLAATSCGSQYPEEIPGGRIQGKVFYSGEAHEKYDRPALGIFAFVGPMEDAIPHATRIMKNPVFSEEGLAYELKYLEPFQYTVVAVILNLDDMVAMPEAVAFPLTVEVTDEEPAVGIDLHIFDF